MGDTPTFLDGLDQYTHEEILAIVRTDAWTPEQE
jgi:hypothetical protein